MTTFLRRHTALFSWLAGIGIPAAVILTGWLVTTSLERSKTQTEYVRIALGILSKTPPQSAAAADPANKPEANRFAEEEMALRKWAVRLLNQSSPEKFNEEEQQALLRVEVSAWAIGRVADGPGGIPRTFALQTAPGQIQISRWNE
eukprot:gene10374-12717_t